MKKQYFALVLFVVFAQQIFSHDTGEMAKHIRYIVSATNGIKMGVLLLSSSPTNTVEEPIWLSFSATNEDGACLYIPTDEHLGDISLFDTNNVPMEKTVEGEKFRYLAVDHWDRSIVRQHHITGGRAPDPWIISKDWSRPLELPSPARLFKVEKQGDYRLVLDIHVFLKNGTNKDSIHFPVLIYPVATVK